MKSYFEKAEKYFSRDVKYYKNDFLIHDREVLDRKENQEKTFLWLTRDTGTHLIELTDRNSGSDNLQLLRELVKQNQKAYLLAGGEIQPIRKESAESLARLHVLRGGGLKFYM